MKAHKKPCLSNKFLRIYILNEYNAIRRNFPKLSPLRAYTKAWNVKVIPIFLIVMSTILGFVPFMIGDKTPFWFPLAAGTIGGLVMSVIESRTRLYIDISYEDEC